MRTLLIIRIITLLLALNVSLATQDGFTFYAVYDRVVIWMNWLNTEYQPRRRYLPPYVRIVD